MENKVFEENLELIKKYDENLFNKILMSENEKSNLAIVQTKVGEYNLMYKGVCLHSQDSAVDEAVKIAQKIEEEENSIRVIYGLGLGYLVEEVSKKIKNSKIIVYEPELEIIKYVLSIAKIDSLFQENVILCNDCETLAKLVFENTDNNSKMKLIYTNPYKQIFADDFTKVLQTIQKAQGQHSANINTLLSKAPSALWHTRFNLNFLFRLPYIKQYENIYKGKTALIVSAGPSLKENIEIIKQNKDKFIIFCVNVAMEFLIKSGIQPDFIVDIETTAGDIYYKNIDISQSNLILEAFSHNQKYLLNAKQKITYISQNNFLNPWVRSLLGLNDNLETMGTVSYTALDSAYIMGFEKIILIGQDLAFKNGQCYAKGSRYEDLECIFDENEKKYVIKAKDLEQYALKLQGRITDWSKKVAQSYINNLNKNIYTVKGQDGTYLPTQTGYALFIEWFEKVASRYKKERPQIKLINSSIGGAQINGFENIALEEAIKEDENVERIELPKYRLDYDKEKCSNEIGAFLEDIKTHEEFTKEAKLHCERFLNELKIKKMITQNALKSMKKHNIALDKLLAVDKGQPWRLYFVQYSGKIIPLIESDFSQDAKGTKEVFEKLLEVYNKILQFSPGYIERLTYSKSFVLK